VERVVETEGGEALLMAGNSGTTSAIAHPAAAAVAPAASWHAIWTRSHCEQLVAQQLAARGFEIFLPEMGTWSRRAGETRLIRVPMFPGYLFVRGALDKQQYVEVCKARGIVRILGDAWNRLALIPEAEIDSIQRVVAADVPVLPHAHLTSGDHVTVIDGPLAGVEGLFVRDSSPRGRLVLSIHLLGRSVAVEIDGAAVTPSAPRKFA
jgi:transcription antitermination factor NusG